MERDKNKALSDVTEFIEGWKKKKEDYRKGWSFKYGWPAKNVKTTFDYMGYSFTITPEDLGLSGDPWADGFMEKIQQYIENDLERFGATNIRSFGDLD